MLKNGDCSVPESISGFSVSSMIVDDLGHQLDGDYDPHGQGGCNHRDTKEWKAAHRKVKKMEQTASAEPVESSPVLLATSAPVGGEATTSIGVDAAIGQVKSLIPDGAGPGLLIGGAAAFAVIGAGIKFGPQVLKARADKQAQSHELEMERLRLERERQDKQDDSHQKCSTERVLLESRISALDSKLNDILAKLEDVRAKAEKASEASSSFAGLSSEGLEEIQTRLAKLEKTLKPSTRSKR
jgi:hypothetical protein